MAEQQVVPWADKMQGMSPPPAADSAPRLKRWADLRWPEFAALDLAHTVAVLPVGATEQHGPHLPLDVDTAIVEAVLAAAAGHLPAEAPVYVLPTLPVGLSPEHERFPGTLTLSAETALALWRDLARGARRDLPRFLRPLLPDEPLRSGPTSTGPRALARQTRRLGAS